MTHRHRQNDALCRSAIFCHGPGEAFVAESKERLAKAGFRTFAKQRALKAQKGALVGL